MILATRDGNVELRSEFGSSSDIRPPWAGWVSQAGLPVTPAQTLGLPAVSNVIRSAAEIVASLPFIVYVKGPTRERAPRSWQYRLLHDRPSSFCDSFEFFYDLALSIEATQNAFVQKAKFRDRVYELYVLDPQRVTVRRDRETGAKLFDYYADSGVVRDLTTSDILHIRGYAQPGSVAGVSLLQVHRDPLGAALAMQGFEGDYFRNGGIPPFWFTGAGNKDHAKEIVDSHNAAHAGVGRQWKPGALWGTVDVKHLPISMEDALFVEAKRLAIEDVCRIWRWPKEMVELSSGQQVPEEWWDERFLKFNVLPRLRRIERAFAADEDLFWDTPLFGEFLTSALERASFVTRVRGYKDARQGGWITANEIRALENYPPKEGADELLETPVGGAPNTAREEPQRSNGHEPDLVAALLGER